MGLFQRTVLKKHLLELNNTEIDAAYKRFTDYFHNSTIQKNIREAKEEQFQEGFLRELFGHIMGYTLNPNPNFNLTTELKNTTNSKKADGAILIDGKAIAVIELKGTETTDLNKIEVQAFGYKNNQSECTYVITSNFEKLRFYIDNTIDYEEFNLFILNRDQFNLLYLCLSYDNIKNNVPKRLKAESVSQEDQITKKLYKDYSEFKRALFNNLVELNPQYDKLLLFKKTQKLLDRFLFIFFAEDRLLLPTNLIFRINQEWKNLQAMRIPVSLYERYMVYFNDLNHGAKVTLPAFGKKTGEAITAEFEIFAYNGGLFLPDEVLDNVKIDDTLLHTYSEKLSHYDFDSDVDVNILGHIFENSLNEIDEIKSEIEGEVVDKTKTKRKKDGVFYTPKYITKYIVDNTVGKLCGEKKAELKLNDEDYINDKKLQTKTKKALLDKLSDYRNWLLDLTICDPACGSGAFLNQALEFLIAEHRYIDELQAKLMGDAMILSDVETSILENNIYGVDLNDESVEIAKLSLWLRTAQKGRKLNSLNNNIKCGNSLIDDPAVAGDKAFSWEKEFPEVFAKGGFDVVIGNPPYGIFMDKKSQDFYNLNFPLTQYKTNLYILFIERMFQLFDRGVFHFIIPKSLLFNTYYEAIRKELIVKSEINEIFTITEKVFEDAEVGSSLILKFTIKAQVNIKNKVRLAEAEKIQNFVSGMGLTENNIEQDFFLTVPNCEISVVSGESRSILKKLLTLEPISNFYILKNGLNPGNVKHILISDNKVNELHKPIIWGKDISKFLINWSGQFINYDQSLSQTISIDDIQTKEGMNKQNRIDFALRSPELFETKKIVVRKTGDSLICAIDENNFYFDTLVHGIYVKNEKYSLEALMIVLNSNSATKIYRLLHDIKGKVFAKISLDNLASFPLPSTIKMKNAELKQLAEQMINKQRELDYNSKKFLSLLKSEFKIAEINKALDSWYNLEYGDFIKELKKRKIELSLQQKSEWMDFFETEKVKLIQTKNEISQMEMETDQLVYELYGLSEEEIKIVEGV
jgi:hypothetical protein